jgi:tetratricopeptide (TPR) repeat protein/outer membrane protein assembly factor BamB
MSLGIANRLCFAPATRLTEILENELRLRTLVHMTTSAGTGEALYGSGSKRPFEIVAAAEQAWDAGDSARAEKLFQEGVAAYRRDEPDGLDFALGRYGAFLVDQGRTDEAEGVLKQAIDLNTDIPAIWSDYIAVVAERCDIETFKAAIERMAARLREGFNSEFILGHARSADRGGATSFAEQVAQWVIERCAREGDDDGRWAAIGDLGRIYERGGHLDQAMKLWRDAFDEGSRDGETITRLSMQLERAKDYSSAIRVIREALARQIPASLEESLHNRLARCEEKATGKARSKTKRADIPAYSVRQPSSWFTPLFQARLKSSVSDLGIVQNVIRCLLTSKDTSTLVDLDAASGSEIRRVENLPLLGEVFYAPDGRAIGIRRTAAVGKGPTLLRFLSADGHVIAESAVPDATSEIALGPGLWYVGCRNGLLYAFGLDGQQHWAWETPGASGYKDNAYFRPCPYYVSSRGSFVAVCSMGNVYAVAPNGRTLWHASLPNEHQTRWNFTVPFPGAHRGQEPYEVLGLLPNAPYDKVKSAYRRLALATHPDRNPEDPDATATFRRVQEAYEHILAGQTGGGAAGARITMTVEISGMGPLASFVTVSDSSVVVGSSQGRIYTFDMHGNLRDARIVGDSGVRVALRPDGTLGAAWCSETLLFFHQGRVVNAAESPDWPHELIMLGNDVVLSRRNELKVMDTYGRVLYALEFSKSLAAVVAHDDTLLCAAGVLAAFRRRAEQSTGF